jgi:pimeloyl-ACP methyl ester carboxylesterase
MRIPQDQGIADELHFPRTPDGWRVALHRYRPRAAALGPPAILCGGYACNRYFLDYDERYSLARFLARAGFDVWVFEARGCGLAHAGRDCARPRSWTFDDLVAFDVPTAVGHVAAVTASEVTWVGHSMGGMLLYAYLGRGAENAHRVRAGVTIASPVEFPTASSDLFREIGAFLLRIPFSDTIYQRTVLTALWTLLGRSSALHVGMNPENVERHVIGRALHLFIENVPRAKLQQLALWALEGAFCSVDRRVDYRSALAQVTIPILAIAGSADRLATPAAVRRALDHLPVPPATNLEFGRAHGHSADYGHVDLILGRAAPTEVFPVVAEWLASFGDGPPAAGEGAPA